MGAPYHRSARTPHAPTKRLIVLLALLAAPLFLGACAIQTPEASTPTDRPKSPRMTPREPAPATVSLTVYPLGVEQRIASLDVRHQNVTDTTMTITPEQAIAVVSARRMSDGKAATMTVILESGLYAGQPVGPARTSNTSGVRSGDGVSIESGSGLHGTLELALPGPGEYEVRARMQHDPGINTPPVKLTVR